MKRVLSFILSFVLAFSIITGMDVSVFATDEFSANKYLAQLSLGGEYIPYQTLSSFYFDYQTGCEIVVDAAKNTSLEEGIAEWHLVKSAANPGNTLYALNYQQQYEVLLYNVIFDALCSEQIEKYNYENSISKVSEFTNTVVESWNSADILDKTDLTVAESEAVKDAAMTFLEKSDTKWTALGEYSAIINELAVCIESIIEIGVDVIEIIDRVAVMVQLMDVGDATISFLYDIKENAGDVFLASAVQEVIDSMTNDWVGIVSKVVTDVGFSFGKIATERLVNLVWAKICATNPICAGMVIGDMIGTAACNALFATEDTIEEYSNMKKFIEVMSATKIAFYSTESECKNNINDETAAKWIFSCDFMYSLIVSDYKCSVKFFEIISTKGLVNKVKNLFGGSGYEKYESFCDSVNGILNSYENVYESFYTSWPYYMEEDYPDVYESYLQKMNNPFEPIVTEVMSVDFFRNEYELAMNQTVKIPAMAYPTTAKNTSLTYSSSNNSVITVASDGTITPVGEGTANVIATANNGVQGFCEITVYPYNVSGNSSGYTIDEYLGSSSEVTIPSEINNTDVTFLTTRLFSGNEDITMVSIPDSVKYIAAYAFENCTNLVTVNLPNGFKEINEYLFSGCTSLASITIPDSVESIERYAFRDCTSLTSVQIGNSVTSIGQSAFSNCSNLPIITIPDNVTSISNDAFIRCDSLERINVNSGNSKYSSINGLLYNKTQEKLVCYPAGKSEKKFVVPEHVTSIEKYAFYGCNIEELTISENVSSIGFLAFRYSDKLKKVNYFAKDCYVNVSLSYIFTKEYRSPFDSCPNLTYVEIGSSVEVLPKRIFTNVASLEEVVFPQNSSLNIIEAYAFENCSNLLTITLPNSLTQIEEGAFNYCENLTSVTIPNSVRKIGASVFGGCHALVSILIPDSVTNIGEYAFDNCISLTAIDVNKNNLAYSSIDGVLYNKDQTILIRYPINKIEKTYNIPSSVTKIDTAAFRECGNLESVELSKNISTIGTNAFHDCTNLLHMTIPDSVTAINSYSLGYYYDMDSGEQKVIEDFIIYGKKGTSAEKYACENNINFIPMKISDTDSSLNSIDYDLKLIIINALELCDLSNVFSVEDNTTIIPVANYNGEYIGTGTEVTVTDEDYGDYTFTCIVKNDTNGDGVCDVLDCAQMALVTKGFQTIDGVYEMAADSNSDDIVDVNDYQSVVNTCLAS